MKIIHSLLALLPLLVLGRLDTPAETLTYPELVHRLTDLEHVGTQLHIWNPLGGWWGEGDEKFLVDGEKFISQHPRR